MRLSHFLLLIGVLSTTALLAQAAGRPFKLDDLARIQEVRDPQCAPEGKSVAYVVSAVDVKEDKSASHVWLAEMDGKSDRQITFSKEGESSPRFSPDGHYLAFTSSRPGKGKGSQIWLLDRFGGEAYQLTELKGNLGGYEWSPDSKRLALVVSDPDPEEDDNKEPGAKPKPPKPIVIDRYHFKEDRDGYLRSGLHTYIYLFDISASKLERLTKSKFDEGSPSWSLDGTRIAFVSNHHDDPDRDISSDLFVTDAKPGSTERALTNGSQEAAKNKPQWSPDGKSIAFLSGEERKWGAYSMEHLAIVPADGSKPAELVVATGKLDRGVSNPRFTNDGQIEFIVDDDRSDYPARISAAGSSNVDKLLAPPVVVMSPNSKGACWAALSGTDSSFTEVYVMDGGKLRQLTHRNDALLRELQLGETREVSFKAKDSTEAHGLLTTPVGYVKGTKTPLVLFIHGGPNGQDNHRWNTFCQWFAANGYSVLQVNYRGSSGRGQTYSRSIAADWGHHEVEDLIAGVDHVIQMGIADPDRLVVGGWSYGGILTDYVIASDTRFKAAVSGAGTAFTVAFYGVDQYIIQYDYEIGPPWTAKGWDTYVKLSYPFLHADRIKTPTMFMGGSKDFNVPLQGGEQMYQALRSLGIETKLIVYPDQFHGITRPSYLRDRYERWVGWYDRFVKNSDTAAPATTAAAAANR
jgi:dipeptidyl aminopeptidase/acylaminoacyl peptidase